MDMDDEKREKIIVGTITIAIGAVAAWYNNNVIMKEPSHDWDDIDDICAEDRATSEETENAFDADEIMSNEEIDLTSDTDHDLEDLNVGGRDSTISSATKKKAPSSTSTTQPPKKRTRSEDELSSAISKITESLREYLRSRSQTFDVKEVMDELNKIPDLDRQQRLKALNWLTENEVKFNVIKNLPLNDKKDYILMCMP